MYGSYHMPSLLACMIGYMFVCGKKEAVIEMEMDHSKSLLSLVSA